MINSLYLSGAALRMGSDVDRDGEILIECGREEGNIDIDEAVRTIRHLAAVFELNLAEMHNAE